MVRSAATPRVSNHEAMGYAVIILLMEWNARPNAHLHRYPHRRAKPAHRTVAERDVAAMRARDVAGNRETKPGTALVLVAGVVQPQERLEHFLAHVLRNARSVVVDRDGQIA